MIFRLSPWRRGRLRLPVGARARAAAGRGARGRRARRDDRVGRGAGGSGRFNFLLTDGRSIAATAAGDTLWYRRGGGAVTVASEPCDDEPGWTEVPGRQVLTAVPSEVAVRPLSSLTEGIAIR